MEQERQEEEEVVVNVEIKCMYVCMYKMEWKIYLIEGLKNICMNNQGVVPKGKA